MQDPLVRGRGGGADEVAAGRAVQAARVVRGHRLRAQQHLFEHPVAALQVCRDG